METVDGKLEKIREIDYFEEGELEEENLISEEDRVKFKTTPPSAEELGRLLKDLVVFYKPLVKQESGITTTVINVLVNSFREAGKFGKFLVEDIENLTLPYHKPIEWVFSFFNWCKNVFFTFLKSIKPKYNVSAYLTIFYYGLYYYISYFYVRQSIRLA